MISENTSQRLELQPDNPQRLANLCGRLNEHIRQLEERLELRITNRGNQFQLSGTPEAVATARHVLEMLYRQTADGRALTPEQIHLALAETAPHRLSPQDLEPFANKAPPAHREPSANNTELSGTAKEPSADSKPSSDEEPSANKEPSADKKSSVNEEASSHPGQATGSKPSTRTGNNPAQAEASLEDDATEASHSLVLRTPKCSVKPRTPHQNQYVLSIMKHDINFGIGPAGTGKTYLAVACAVEALLNEQVSRILLVRPAVEAGEKLGFLPGDLSQKVDPYLRPLYDALYEMLGFERVAKLIERNMIEIAPLAYMRGRTLNNSFIILDESQNTTTSQMKMFLTRIGFGSTAVITGDVTQIDLPKGTRSGLVQVTSVLRQVKGVSFTWFNSGDVVRHPIVQRIVDAYDEYDKHNISALNSQDKERLHERDN